MIGAKIKPVNPAAARKGKQRIKIHNQSSRPFDSANTKNRKTLKKGKKNCFHFDSIICLVANSIGIVHRTIGVIQMNEILYKDWFWYKSGVI